MSQTDKLKKPAKRQRREAAIAAKREARQREQAARRRSALLTYGGLAVGAALVVAVVVIVNLRGRSGLVEIDAPTLSARAAQGAPAGAPGAGAPTPGEVDAAAGAEASPRGVVKRYPSQGVAHIRLGDSHPPYNSNPPTSGWHTPETAPWGAHRREIPDQVIVHNLEHGGIWISYRDPSNTELVDRLETLAGRYRSKVIVTPRPQNDAPIAVAAWTRLMKLDEYDEDKIVRFIEAYRNRGPEQVPD